MRTEDGYIIQQCLDGNAAAFGFLVKKYKEPVYALAYSRVHNFHDAQDITQEVFIKAYRKLRDLRRRDNFMGWLCRITNNMCKDWLRSRSRQPDLEFVGDQDPEILNQSSMDSYHENMVYESIHYALDSLPELYSQVLILRYFGGMTTSEMSRFLAVSKRTIERRLREARIQLKEGMLAMMSKSYEQHEMPANFTFRIVELIKRIKISPTPRMAGVPLGLSLAAGIIIAGLSLNSHLRINLASFPMSSPFPVEAKSLEAGEIPVDVLAGSRMPSISGRQEDIAEAALFASTKAASDGGQIVFWADTGLWVMNADGGNMERISIELPAGIAQNACDPAWSPDGQKIAFTNWTDAISQRDIYVMNADGSSVKRLTNIPKNECNPAWSPDGEKIAFGGGSGEGVYVMNIDGSGIKALVEEPGHEAGWPAWSPDGEKIAYYCYVGNKPGIWVMDANGGNRKQIHDWGLAPDWSPDGNKLVFISWQDSWNPWGREDIYLINADGTGLKRLTEPGPKGYNWAVWSPDGSEIAFRSWEGDNPTNIYIMNADGSNVCQITNTPWNAYGVAWTAFPYSVEPSSKLPTTWGETKTN